MNFKRLIALLLTTCFVADPSTLHALHSFPTYKPVSLAAPFAEQALISRFVSSEYHPRNTDIQHPLIRSRVIRSVVVSLMSAGLLSSPTASSLNLPGSVALSAQTPPAPASLSLATINRLVRHLEDQVALRNLSPDFYNRYRTATYWQSALNLPTNEAQIVSQMTANLQQNISARLRAIQLDENQLSARLRIIYLRQQWGMLVLYTAISSTALEERVRMVAEQVLPLMIEEQREVARFLHEKRQATPFPAPMDLLIRPQIEAIAAFVAENSLGSSLTSLSRALPLSYARLIQTAPNAFVVKEQLAMNAFDALEAALLRYNYALGVEIAPRQQGSGVQFISAQLYRIDASRDRTVMLGANPIRISRGQRVWNYESIVGILGIPGGMDLGGNRILLVEGTDASTSEQLLALKKVPGRDTNLLGPWNPLFDMLLKQAFPENSPAVLTPLLENDTLRHELLHRWYDQQKLADRPSPLSKLFADQIPAIAAVYRSEAAAYLGNFAHAQKPLWELMQRLLTLRRDNQPSENVLSEQLSSWVLREIVKQLPPNASATLKWPATGNLRREQGMELLRAVLSNQVSVNQLQTAARRAYEQNVGPMMPAVNLNPSAPPRPAPRNNIARSWLAPFIGAFLTLSALSGPISAQPVQPIKPIVIPWTATYDEFTFTMDDKEAGTFHSTAQRLPGVRDLSRYLDLKVVFKNADPGAVHVFFYKGGGPLLIEQENEQFPPSFPPALMSLLVRGITTIAHVGSTLLSASGQTLQVDLANEPVRFFPDRFIPRIRNSDVYVLIESNTEDKDPSKEFRIDRVEITPRPEPVRTPPSRSLMSLVPNSPDSLIAFYLASLVLGIAARRGNRRNHSPIDYVDAPLANRRNFFATMATIATLGGLAGYLWGLFTTPRRTPESVKPQPSQPLPAPDSLTPDKITQRTRREILRSILPTVVGSMLLFANFFTPTGSTFEMGMKPMGLSFLVASLVGLIHRLHRSNGKSSRWAAKFRTAA